MPQFSLLIRVLQPAHGVTGWASCDTRTSVCVGRTWEISSLLESVPTLRGCSPVASPLSTCRHMAPGPFPCLSSAPFSPLITSKALGLFSGHRIQGVGCSVADMEPALCSSLSLSPSFLGPSKPPTCLYYSDTFLSSPTSRRFPQRDPQKSPPLSPISPLPPRPGTPPRLISHMVCALESRGWSVPRPWAQPAKVGMSEHSGPLSPVGVEEIGRRGQRSPDFQNTCSQLSPKWTSSSVAGSLVMGSVHLGLVDLSHHSLTSCDHWCLTLEGQD